MNLDKKIIGDLQYTFRQSKKARRMRLQIDAGGNLKIVVPIGASIHQIEHFVINHFAWIEKNIKKAEEKKEKYPIRRYENGDKFLFLGELYTLMVQTSEKIREGVQWNEKELVMVLKPGSKKNGLKAYIQKKIIAFFKKKAEEVIHDRLEHFNEIYGFRYQRVTLRNQKTRWGSCSREGNLNFNWRLIMAPIGVIDYVVVHELCHLKEMNHSRSFWRRVEENIPNHKAVKKWLKENHYLLEI